MSSFGTFPHGIGQLALAAASLAIPRVKAAETLRVIRTIRRMREASVEV